MGKHTQINRRGLILGAAAAMGGSLLTACGGGSDAQDDTQVPVSDTHLYRTFMAMRAGMSQVEAIARVGRAPDLLPTYLSQRWTADGQTLTLSYSQYQDFTPQLMHAKWQWSPTSKTAHYTFQQDAPPAFMAAT